MQINRQLGAVDGIANAQYDLAGLDHDQGNTSRALERLAESWGIISKLGHAMAIAVCGQFYDQLLASTEPSRALEILRTSREALQLLGMTADVAQMDELIQRIERPAPPAPRRWFVEKVRQFSAEIGFVSATLLFSADTTRRSAATRLPSAEN